MKVCDYALKYIIDYYITGYNFNFFIPKAPIYDLLYAVIYILP